MNANSDNPWSFVPHQHAGVHAEIGDDAHIKSPQKHNGAFKSTGVLTFMGAPYCPPDRDEVRKRNSKLCFLGAPWDMGNIVRTASSSGPKGVREESAQYFPYMFEYDVDLLSYFRVVDCGDVPVVPGNNELTQKYICDYVRECLEGGAQVILLGGDHSIPIPGARALSEYLSAKNPGASMSYLHIDCHLDAAVDWAGNELTNASGSPMALSLENCHAKNMAHLGSRNGLNPKDWFDFYVDNDIPVLSMRDVVDKGVEHCARLIFDRGADGTEATYCTWDTDSMDSSCMPGTTYAECYGFKTREGIQLARVAGEYGIDVFDFAELSPMFDQTGISAKLICTLIYHYLGSRAATLRAQGHEYAP